MIFLSFHEFFLKKKKSREITCGLNYKFNFRKYSAPKYSPPHSALLILLLRKGGPHTMLICLPYLPEDFAWNFASKRPSFSNVLMNGTKFERKMHFSLVDMQLLHTNYAYCIMYSRLGRYVCTYILNFNLGWRKVETKYKHVHKYRNIFFTTNNGCE